MKASTFWGIIGLLILVLAAIASVPAHAQDIPQSEPIVCRTGEYPSFVVRIPPEWNNPDLPSWSVLAAGFGAYADPSDGVTFRADGLEHVDVYGEGYPDWYKYIQVGNVLVFNGDYSFVGVYNTDTPLCDENDYPVAPAATPEPDTTCAATAINGANGKPYCYVPQANGVVPVPPAP